MTLHSRGTRRPRPGARLWALLLLPALLPLAALASSEVQGETRIHRGPTGEPERCVMLARMPGGRYLPEQEAQERALCAMDFHAGTHALCPKLFSTSPGTLVYELAGGPYAGRMAAFEREVCPSSRIDRRAAPHGAVSFKMSVNTRETSATFSNASFIYYHFARYFDAAVHVPPAVMRTIGRAEHLARVAQPGLTLSAGKPALAMLHAGWTAVVGAARDPASYSPADELLTADRRQFYGVLLHPEGRCYGEEINGSRRSGWGDGQSRDFQQTAPFVALAADRPLAEAIRHGLATGHAAGQIPAAGRELQMVWWMRELVDITLLDHILGQQDRIGNIDYLTHWVWVQDGQVRQRRADGAQPPPDIAAFGPTLLKRTELGDNDAAVRISYANFTQRTGMLDRLRRYPRETYAKLVALARDFEALGPLHAHVRTSYGLSEPEFRRVAANVRSAAEILQGHCRGGRLRFDLDPAAWMRDGDVAAARIDCDRP